MPKPLTVTVLVMMYLPLVAMMVSAGYVFGWEVPVAVLVFLGALWLRGRRRGDQPRSPGRLRTVLELIVFALLGSVLGGLLFGGLGVVLGFAVGFVVRLGEVPVTGLR
jgi:uncharacterized membrane protein YedE/YeeE